MKQIFSLLFFTTLLLNSNAQVPSTCLEIESILVDACVPGSGCTSSSSPNCSCEGKNEMVKFIVGPTAISISDITVNWPNNSFLGITSPNATTGGLVSILQSTITSPCGKLLEPVAGIIPSGKTVLLISSTDMCTTANSFSGLTDTLYVLFQNAGNFQGHFANHNNSGTQTVAPTGASNTRTLSVGLISSGCTDVVTYDRSLLLNINGMYGGAAALNDGARVDFSWAGIPAYINIGCQIPYTPTSVSATGQSSACVNENVGLSVSITGDYTSVSWSGGNGVFTNGNSTSPTYTVSPLDGGTIHLVATVVSPCNELFRDTVDLIILPLPVAQITAGGPLTFCSGNSVQLTASGGTSYLWSTGSGATSISVSSSGTYTLTATNSCGSDDSSVVVQVNTNPVTTASSNSPICEGEDLSLTATFTSGATYAWTGPNGFTSNLQNPVLNQATTTANGNYIVTITLNGCSSNSSTSVTINPIPSLIAGSNSPLCVGAGLNLNANFISGATYSWTGPNGFTSNLQNPVIPSVNLSDAGTYDVTITVNGCSASASMVVVVNNAFDATISPAGPFCSNDLPITLTATDPGGLWTGTGITNSATGEFDPSIAGAGNHIITYTISGSCGDSQNTTIVINATPVSTAASNSPVCENDTLYLNSAFVSGAGYSWTGPNGFSSSLQNPFVFPALIGNGGNYILNLSLNGCSSSSTINVTVNASPLSIAGSNSPVCVGGNINLSGSFTSGASYSWSGPNGYNSAMQNPIINPATLNESGIYTLTVTAGSCSSTSQTSVTVNANPDATITPVSPVCTGDNAIQLIATSGGGSWSGTGTNSSGIFDPSVSGAGTFIITYSATISGCSSSDTVSIIVLPDPVVAISAGGSLNFCSGESVVLTATGTGNFTWSNGAAGNSITVTTSGNYFAVAGNICGSDTSNLLNTTVSIVVADFSSNPSSGIAPLDVQFTNQSTNATSYSWNFGDTTTSSLVNPQHQFVENGTYPIWLFAVNSDGCVDSTFATIVVLDSVYIFVPNVFSPNGDGINDYFEIPVVNISNLEAILYNRWGQEVGAIKSSDDKWDGNNQSGNPAPEGTYFYLINYTDTNGSGKTLNGSFTLIRN